MVLSDGRVKRASEIGEGVGMKTIMKVEDAKEVYARIAMIGARFPPPNLGTW